MNSFLHLVINIYLSGLLGMFLFLFLVRKYIKGYSEEESDSRIIAILSFKASVVWFITTPKMIYWFVVEMKRLLKEDKKN